MAKKVTPQELAAFGTLPDEALVSEPVVIGLTDSSPATVWRMCRDGRLPRPVKITGRSVRWQVGALRKALAAFAPAN